MKRCKHKWAQRTYHPNVADAKGWKCECGATYEYDTCKLIQADGKVYDVSKAVKAKHERVQHLRELEERFDLVIKQRAREAERAKIGDTCKIDGVTYALREISGPFFCYDRMMP